ncbi:hypothetical protein ACJX0J_027362, partial [Zea mays]
MSLLIEGNFILVYYLPDVSIIHTIQTFLCLFLFFIYQMYLSPLWRSRFISQGIQHVFWFAIISTLLLSVLGPENTGHGGGEGRKVHVDTVAATLLRVQER